MASRVPAGASEVQSSPAGSLAAAVGRAVGRRQRGCPWPDKSGRATCSGLVQTPAQLHPRLLQSCWRPSAHLEFGGTGGLNFLSVVEP